MGEDICSMFPGTQTHCYLCLGCGDKESVYLHTTLLLIRKSALLLLCV